MEPVISVIIPSRGRPSKVPVAVRSALNQTFARLEVIVVLDGPDEESAAVLDLIEDPRFRYLVTDCPGGAQLARDRGVRDARASWIAFLDDDDEWLPEKLECQLAAAQASSHALPIVSCRSVVESRFGRSVWPRRLPDPSEPICEYLFTRHSLFAGEGFLQTSTFFAPKRLLLEAPFQGRSRQHDDWDWVLRVANYPGTGLEFVDKPLSIWNASDSGDRVSNTKDWETTLKWCDEMKSEVTPRAYAGMLATVASPAAARAGAWSCLLPLLCKAVRQGDPRLLDLLLLIGMWFSPGKLRRRIRAFFQKD